MRARTDSYTSVEKAFSRVLRAERDALAQIAACESRADKKLQDTRQTVRAMLRRTQERITRLHSGCVERTRQLVTHMESEAAEGAGISLPDDTAEDTRLAAVRAVAIDLTTPERSDVG